MAFAVEEEEESSPPLYSVSASSDISKSEYGDALCELCAPEVLAFFMEAALLRVCEEVLVFQCSHRSMVGPAFPNSVTMVCTTISPSCTRQFQV